MTRSAVWALVFSFCWSTAGVSGEKPFSASSELGGWSAALAADGDPTTSWCAEEESSSTGDWWAMELPPEASRIGAIYMQSGLAREGRLVGHKIREFAWEVQRAGHENWETIPGTQYYADRYQLIFRFSEIDDVARIRLRMDRRDSDEKPLVGSDFPCLREVQFFSESNAKIAVKPWFFQVAMWEEGNLYRPTDHFGQVFDVKIGVDRAMDELSQGAHSAALDSINSVDDLWIGEFHTERLEREVSKAPRHVVRVDDRDVDAKDLPVAKRYPEWILHEPAPAGFFLSGNYRHFKEVNAQLNSGFYRFIRDMMERRQNTIPVLGACGGHQLTGMAGASPYYFGYEAEFREDHLLQADITCSTLPQISCGKLSPAECCLEGGSPNPFRVMAANTPEYAMKNRYSSERIDMLFNLLPPEGFESYFWHTDCLNPHRVASVFEIIATYPKSVQKISRETPCLVQAIKQHDKPIYGTQFHWDEHRGNWCERTDGFRNMERILKNFVWIALNRLNEPSAVQVEASNSFWNIREVSDLDRNSLWCGRDGSTLTFKLKNPMTVGTVLSVEGRDAGAVAGQDLEFEISQDGQRWEKLTVQKKESAFGAQLETSLRCEREKGVFPGREDGQTFLTHFEPSRESSFVRVTMRSQAGEGCLREMFLFNRE